MLALSVHLAVGRYRMVLISLNEPFYVTYASVGIILSVVVPCDPVI